MSTIDERMYELRTAGKSYREIAEALTLEQFKTPQDKPITDQWVQSRWNYRFGAKKEAALKRRGRSLDTTMMSIPVEETKPQSSKVITIISEAADIREILKGYL